jgi:hypothetical protein
MPTVVTAAEPLPAPDFGRAAHREADAGETRLAVEDDEFGHLFESTILRTSEDAAVRVDPDEINGEAASAAAILGDHDGETILGSELAAALAAQRGGSVAVPPPPPSNPAAAAELVFSNGEIVAVDGPVIIGRKPQAARFSGAKTPKMVTVTGPNNDISRSHLEIAPDGAYLMATDLGSTNGTILQSPDGSHPLTAHAPERIAIGSRLDLGDGVIIDVRTAR